MKQKKYLVGLAILSILITGAGVIAATKAAEIVRGDVGGRREMVNFDNTAARDAISNNDFAAWQTAVGDNAISEKITQDNFGQFVQMHNLREQGKAKFDEAQAIAKDLRIEKQGRMMKGGGQQGMMGNGDALAAIEAGDYNAWKEAVGDSPITEQINEGNFARFVEIHQLMEDKKFDEVKVIRDELNLTNEGKPHFMGMGQKEFRQGRGR